MKRTPKWNSFKYEDLQTPTPRPRNTPCQTTDPDIFFPHSTDDEGLKLAKSFCERCPIEIKNACLDFAMTNKIRYGVWGGLSEIERYKMRRKGTYVSSNR